MVIHVTFVVSAIGIAFVDSFKDAHASLPSEARTELTDLARCGFALRQRLMHALLELLLELLRNLLAGNPHRQRGRRRPS